MEKIGYAVHSTIGKVLNNHNHAKDLMHICKMHTKNTVLKECGNITSLNELKILLKMCHPGDLFIAHYCLLCKYTLLYK